MTKPRNFKKAPKGKRQPLPREPRGARASVNYNELKPVWRFEIFDRDGPWGSCRLTSAQSIDGLIKDLASHESMTWGEILKDKKRNHDVGRGSLCKQAARRLAEIKQDDVDSLFRIRFAGKERLWGIRDRNTFKVLWWDPEHEVCPSKKK